MTATEDRLTRQLQQYVKRGLIDAPQSSVVRQNGTHYTFDGWGTTTVLCKNGAASRYALRRIAMPPKTP